MHISSIYSNQPNILLAVREILGNRGEGFIKLPLLSECVEIDLNDLKVQRRGCVFKPACSRIKTVTPTCKVHEVEKATLLATPLSVMRLYLKIIELNLMVTEYVRSSL